ncbi:unnamed protein product [Soboliphyme baturini]|uniref:STAS domain-containing protein n=1 Tax=Soboliphyme baturini TaxID=241478 RepID=A0A183IIP0_9BILA|nr:unnamed protein product [Soboliphyme baturini]
MLGDLVAGITVGIMSIPQGPFAIISLMVSVVLNRFSSCQTSCPPLISYNESYGRVDQWFCGSNDATNCSRSDGLNIEVAPALTFLVGVFQIMLGILNMGFLAVYLSEQLVEGLTTAAGLFVLTSQIGGLLGIPNLPKTGQPLDIIRFYGCLMMRIVESNFLPVVISSACIIVLLLNKLYLSPFTKRKIKFPVPMDLILIVILTVLSNTLNLKETFGLSVVGKIPRRMLAPQVPSFRLMANMVPDALAIAVVSYSISLSIAKMFSQKHSYRIRANQCVLSAIIVVALKETFSKFSHLPKLWKISKTDFWIWIVSFFAVAFLDVTYGLMISVVFALVTVVVRSQWPDRVCLGVIPGTELYRGINAYEETQEFPNIKIFRFDSPLYFANAEMFKKYLYESTGVDPISVFAGMKRINTQRTIYSADEEIAKLDSGGGETVCCEISKHNADECKERMNADNDLLTVIIDCSSFPYIDLSAVNALFHVYQEYRAVGVNLVFAQCKVAVRQMLEKSCFYSIVPRSAVYMSVHDAVVDTITASRASS